MPKSVRADEHYALLFLEDEEDALSAPERGLWAAVVWRVVSDYIQGRELPEGKKAEYSQTAEAWIFSPSSPLDGVCDILALDPRRIRSTASSMAAEELRRRVDANERRQKAPRRRPSGDTL